MKKFHLPLVVGANQEDVCEVEYMPSMGIVFSSLTSTGNMNQTAKRTSTAEHIEAFGETGCGINRVAGESELSANVV